MDSRGKDGMKNNKIYFRLLIRCKKTIVLQRRAATIVAIQQIIGKEIDGENKNARKYFRIIIKEMKYSAELLSVCMSMWHD